MNQKNQAIDLTTDSIPKLLRQLFIPAYGIGLRVEQLILVPGIGIGIAVSTLVAQNHGAVLKNRVKESIRAGILYFLVCLF